MPMKKLRNRLRPHIQRNHGQPCGAEGCKGTREGGSRHCDRHKMRRRKYGHELGRKILKRDYAGERKWVAGLFASNPEHTGVANAVAWVGRWMDAASNGDKAQPGYVHIARLHRHDVAPLTALIELAAVWLHIYLRRLPDDQRATFALAIALLGLAPKDQAHAYQRQNGVQITYRDAAFNDRKDVGDYIRLHLVPLFVTITRTFEQQQEAERDAQASLSSPFTNAPKRTRRKKAP